MPIKPNEVHQLLITVSKHFHIGSKEQIRHQIKPMDVTLKTLKKSERNHFVHYIMRDEASGFFYAECCSHRNLTPIKDFLLRSWFEKKASSFCGIPKSLVFTKTAMDFFGEDSYSDLITELNIKIKNSDSGFSSGVRVFRDWEDDIYFRTVADEDEDFNELQLITNWNPKTTAFYSNLKSFRYSKFYQSEPRQVFEDDYGAYLIKKYGSKDFKKTDLFPTVETVSDLMLLLNRTHAD